VKVTWEWVEERLVSARNFWLATSTDRGPYVRPVWCLWWDGGLLFTSSPTSRKARAIGADPRVSVHLELVREVVVLDGTVEETEPAAEAADAYAEKYGWRPPAAQRWYLLRPRSCYAADEATFPESATVFTLVEEA
jgi:nitroimidazol reductase NimA-like FMN-containing flavoprotein (pyridoxamine 5'-phosphate oxidase superfamily)